MIFSDNYTVHERYSLLNGEKLADYSEMPWLYTPLVDEIYKPTHIPVGVKNSLNRVFDYDYLFQEVEAIKEEEKALGIFHQGDTIESYKSVFKMRYSTVRFQLFDYYDKTGSHYCKDLFDRLHSFLFKKDYGYAAYIGAEHHVDGTITGLSIQSRDYDVSSYEDSMLKGLCDYSSKHPDFCKGVLTVRNNNRVSFYSSFMYPKKVAVITRERGSKFSTSELLSRQNTKYISGRQGMARHLHGYSLSNLITQQQVEQIIDLVPDMTLDAKVQIEHVFEGSELIDIVVHVLKYVEFEQVEVPQRWIHNFDEDGNRIY